MDRQDLIRRSLGRTDRHHQVRRGRRGDAKRIEALRTLNLSARMWALFEELEDPDTGEPWKVCDVAKRTNELQYAGYGIASSAPLISQLRSGTVTGPSYAAISSIAMAFGVPVEYFTVPNWREMLRAESARRVQKSA